VAAVAEGEGEGEAIVADETANRRTWKAPPAPPPSGVQVHRSFIVFIPPPVAFIPLSPTPRPSAPSAARSADLGDSPANSNPVF